jgi:hypothetical protein
MGLFDGGGDAGGLMGMYANPQMAGLLGMSQGLLSAAGPSRLPVTMGQALGAGMQGMQQNAGNAYALQKQMLQMQAMQGLMGGGTPAAQPPAAGIQGSPVMGSANSGPMSGLSAGMGSMAPTAAPQPAPQPAAQAGAGIYGKSPQQLFQQGMLMNMAGMQGGGDLMRIAVEHDPTLAAQMPTDITKMGVQGGMTPDQIQAANASGVAKANYIAPLNARPGAIIRDPLTMQPMAFNPQIPTGGTPTFDASGNVIGIRPLAGAADITSQMAAAKTAGEGSALPYAGVDAQGNPLPVTNRTAAATGNLPLPLRNINPGAVSPGGQVAQYPDLQTGLQAMDQNLANYAGKPDTGTLGQVITKWVGSPPNAPAYIKDVTARLGIGASTPVDLTNPAQRQAIATAIMLHENGPGAVFRSGQGGGAPAQGGAIYAAPPMGAANAANASQGAPSKQMADSYSGLSNSDASYQQSREALQEMINLAHNKGAAGAVVGVLPASVGTKISPDAATYQKLHATYVALQGKALGSGGTDASRATIDEAVPTYDKPQSAMVGGLTTQLNNLDLSHIKTQFLTPVYQQGNEKTYTQQSAAFDQNIKPSMVQALTLSGDAQRAAVQAAVKANPSLRSNFEWAFNNGLLK